MLFMMVRNCVTFGGLWWSGLVLQSMELELLRWAELTVECVEVWTPGTTTIKSPWFALQYLLRLFCLSLFKETAFRPPGFNSRYRYCDGGEQSCLPSSWFVFHSRPSQTCPYSPLQFRMFTKAQVWCHVVHVPHKLTLTWFEHAAFWSGVRRATVAPQSPGFVLYWLGKRIIVKSWNTVQRLLLHFSRNALQWYSILLESLANDRHFKSWCDKNSSSGVKYFSTHGLRLLLVKRFFGYELLLT